MKKYYQILGLEEGVTLAEVEQKYRQLLLEFDPQKQEDDLKEFFKSEQEQVKEAYENISLSFTNINKAPQKEKTDKYQSFDEFKKVNEKSSSSKKVLIKAFIVGVVIFIAYLFIQKRDSVDPADYESYYQSAKQYQKNEKYKLAIEDYKKCIAIYPNSDSIFAFIAQCYYEQEDYENAVRNFSTAIDFSSSQNADYFFERGKSYSKLTQHIQAQSDFDEAISIDPANADFHLSKGDDFFLQAEYSRAKQAYIKYLDLNSNYIGYYKRGNANYKLEKLDDAIKDYTKSIELNQADSKSYRNRGIARYETCQEGACSDLKKASDLGDSKAYDEYKRISNNNECD